MTRILVVGEDALSCALGEQLVRRCLPTWQLASPSINTMGVTHLRKALHRYADYSRNAYPVLCIADTDGGCALELVRSWEPVAPHRLLLRLAVPEAESWAMADPDGFASAFQVPAVKVPREPDKVTDAKATVLAMARRSSSRAIRNEVVSAFDPAKQGTGYNLHLCHFVHSVWKLSAAIERSPSLQRAASRVQALAAGR